MEGLKHIHYLTPGLVEVLRKLIEAVKKKDQNKVHLQRDLILSHNEYANAQKLRYFALIAQVDRRPGCWLITSRGGAFLRNDEAVIYWVETQDNRIIRKSEERRKIIDYYPAYDPEWFQTNFYSQRITNQQVLMQP